MSDSEIQVRLLFWFSHRLKPKAPVSDLVELTRGMLPAAKNGMIFMVDNRGKKSIITNHLPT